MSAVAERRRAPIDRTAAQRAQSLRLANMVRVARARMKEQLRAGTVDAVDLIVQPPDFLQSMKVGKFLVSIPKMGPTKARMLMLRVRIAEGKTVGGLSERQRVELATLLRSRRHGG